MLSGLRTIVYPAPDLAASKRWFSSILETEPYFDQPFYVGFEIGGYELGLDPGGKIEDGPVTYWGVVNADDALAELLSAGAPPQTPVREVGEGIRLASVREPGGAILGIIENPHFTLS